MKRDWGSYNSDCQVPTEELVGFRILKLCPLHVYLHTAPPMEINSRMLSSSSLKLKLPYKNIEISLRALLGSLVAIYFLLVKILKHFSPWVEIGYADLLQKLKHYKVLSPSLRGLVKHLARRPIYRKPDFPENMVMRWEELLSS